MECKKCHSKWETDQRISKSIVACPFCGDNLGNDSKDKFFDNSRDTLIFIAKQHGRDVLLGDKLKNFFSDYAPGIAVLRKNVVFSVHTSGAADILKREISTKESEREIAYKQAVQKVIDTYGTERSLVEGVVIEFTDALGWKIKAQKAAPGPQPQKRQTSPAQVQQPSKPQAQPKPISTQIPLIVTEILGGKKRGLQFGGYSWRVLDVHSYRALLLTEDIIEKRRYHSSFTDTTWEECELRQYLNGEFLQKFSGQDQAWICQVSNSNSNNQWFGTKGGGPTTDSVFLLSIEETVKYFGDSGQLQRRPEKDSWWIDDRFGNERQAKYGNKAWWWWLRSPGRIRDIAAFVFDVGDLHLYGRSVNYVEGGVRPALWLNLKS